MKAQLVFRKNYRRWANKPERKQSGEIDFGCWWGENGPATWPRFMVSWICNTGELYAVSLAASDDKYVVLAKTKPHDEDAAENLMRHWANTECEVFQHLTKLAERIRGDVERLRHSKELPQ